MDAPVTGFPFNVLSDPMYVGTTLNFLGHAIMYGCSMYVLMFCD